MASTLGTSYPGVPEGSTTAWVVSRWTGVVVVERLEGEHTALLVCGCSSSSEVRVRALSGGEELGRTGQAVAAHGMGMLVVPSGGPFSFWELT